MNREKIVKYDQWCHKCEYYKANPSDDDNPCEECLDNPVNIDSHQPTMFKEKE